MKRENIEDKYKWDLTSIMESRQDWEKECSKVKKSFAQFEKYRGRLDDLDLTLELLKLTDLISQDVEEIYVYAYLLMYSDGSDSSYVSLAQRAEAITAGFNAATSFITPELTALSDDVLNEMISDERFANYRYTLESIIKEKKHILSDKEEFILARLGEVLGGFKDIFSKIDNVDFPHPVIKAGKKKIELTHGAYSKLLQSSDVKVRRKAFTTYYKLYEDRINTIASCYSNSIKKRNIICELRGYKSALSASMSNEDVPVEVYDKLIESVDNYLPKLHEYVEYRRDQLGGELHMYDMYVPLVPGAELGLDYEDAFKIVLKALAPLGNEYLYRLIKMHDTRRIDVYESDGKRSGAFSWGTYKHGSFVMLNHSKTTHDVFTIAHELGHAMHSEYSNEAQVYHNAGYSIFVAEVASTTNEVLLLKYLLSVTRDEDVKKFLLSYYLDMFRTTLFRQTMFSEFEEYVHGRQQKGYALTVDDMSKEYFKLNKKYYGKGVVHDKQIKYEWARIPHFYNAFYVYKYATGLVTAVTFANNILNGGEHQRELYFDKFLRAGGTKSPYEIILDAGVDLCSENPYNIALKEFGRALDELKKLG